MNILIIGDIFGECGLEYLKLVYREICETENISFTIANAENVSGGNGISRADYYTLCDLGIDVITMGNHTFGRRDIITLSENENNIIRPVNYPPSVPGKGYTKIKCGGKNIGIINAMGRVNLLNIDCPFTGVADTIDKLKNRCDMIFLDFHAEATSEKRAMGYFVDGKITCMFGTHTHVQTADECILPKGTAYITDVGMTGAVHSVLGVSKDVIIERFLTGMPQKFEHASGKAKLCGAVVTVDDNTNRAESIKRILYTD